MSIPNLISRLPFKMTAQHSQMMVFCRPAFHRNSSSVSISSETVRWAKMAKWQMTNPTGIIATSSNCMEINDSNGTAFCGTIKTIRKRLCEQSVDGESLWSSSSLPFSQRNPLDVEMTQSLQNKHLRAPYNAMRSNASTAHSISLRSAR